MKYRIRTAYGNKFIVEKKDWMGWYKVSFLTLETIDEAERHLDLIFQLDERIKESKKFRAKTIKEYNA